MGINTGYLTADRTIKGDELFTPNYAVYPILKYLDKKQIIWCPFDKKTSSYVQIFQEEGYNIIYSHLDEGKDFFEYEPDNYDIIISNPPFSKKDKIIKRLYELDKPYCVLMPLPTLQGQKRFKYMLDCQALIFDKRISYYSDEEKTKMETSPAFASIYLCRKFLPKDLIFEEIQK